MFLEKEGKLIYSYDGETVCIEAWGKDALRVRATKNRSFTGRDWALEAKDAHAGEVEIFEDPSAKGGAFANMYEGTDTSYGKITNGKLHHRSVFRSIFPVSATASYGTIRASDR